MLSLIFKIFNIGHEFILISKTTTMAASFLHLENVNSKFIEKPVVKIFENIRRVEAASYNTQMLNVYVPKL